MSTLSQFMGGAGVRPVAVQTNSALPAIISTHPTNAAVAEQTTQVLSGACTAGALKTVLSVTGKGAITWLGVGSADATARTHRLRVTIDGVVVLDRTSASSVTATRMIIAHGGWSGNATIFPVIEGTPLFYNQSLLIEYASSLTETDKAAISYINYLR